MKKLGWLKPSSITSEKDSVNVRNAKSENSIDSYTEPDFRTQRKNQEVYEQSSTNLKPGDFVYLDFDEKLFDKSFDASV